MAWFVSPARYPSLFFFTFAIAPLALPIGNDSICVLARAVPCRHSISPSLSGRIMVWRLLEPDATSTGKED
jgi:hypothetical protein